YLSSGPYLLTEFERGNYLTLEANPDYAGDRQPKIQTVTIRYNGDPMAQVQALENGELDLISPQASADTLEALEGLGAQVDVISQDGAVYEHVDSIMSNGGAFDSEAYGGDEDPARMVRSAFLTPVPREETLTSLLQPLRSEAELRDSLTQVPGS